MHTDTRSHPDFGVVVYWVDCAFQGLALQPAHCAAAGIEVEGSREAPIVAAIYACESQRRRQCSAPAACLPPSAPVAVLATSRRLMLANAVAS